MISIDDIEIKQQGICNRVASLRRAADTTRLLKPVIRSYDGKMYNCRFDEAIQALSDDNARLSVSNSYGWFYIYYRESDMSYNDQIALLTGYSCKSAEYKPHQTDQDKIMFDGKRIKAAAMVAELDAKREALLKEAYDLEDYAGNLPDVLKHIQDTEKLLHHLTVGLPSIVMDLCRIKRYY